MAGHDSAFRAEHPATNKKNQGGRKNMKTQVVLVMATALVGALLLGGCATPPQVVQVEEPSGQQQAMTMPKSTWTGGASGAQQDALAKEMAQADRNAMTQAD